MKIHREQIIQMALALLDRDGLEGVTLRRVATELHVHAGALYWHVRSKQELLDEMANALLATQFAQLEGPAAGQHWSDWLRDISQRLRQAMLSHREGAHVVAGAGFDRAVLLARLVVLTLESLVQAGFSPRAAFLTCTTTFSYVYGFVIEEQASPTEDAPPPAHAGEDTILGTIYQEKLTHDYTDDDDFLEGLEIILAGVSQRQARA